MELITDMLRTVARLVHLPDVEFVAHLWDHPKAPPPSPPLPSPPQDEPLPDPCPYPRPWPRP